MQDNNKDLRRIKALVSFMKEVGVSKFKSDGLEVEFFSSVFSAPAITQFVEHQEKKEAKFTDEDMMFWSAE